MRMASSSPISKRSADRTRATFVRDPQDVEYVAGRAVIEDEHARRRGFAMEGGLGRHPSTYHGDPDRLKRCGLPPFYGVGHWVNLTSADAQAGGRSNASPRRSPSSFAR